jgi:hypothetical protein
MVAVAVASSLWQVAPMDIVLAASGEWSTGTVWLRFGLPVLLLLVGAAVYLWGRKERTEARSQIGMKGGFGGPPGTLDVGTEVGFGVDGSGPDPQAGRTKILSGLVLMAAGALLLVIMAVWKLLA